MFSIQSGMDVSVRDLARFYMNPITHIDETPNPLQNYAIVPANTDVTVGTVSARVNGSNEVVVTTTDSFYADGTSQTFAGGSPTTSNLQDKAIQSSAVMSGAMGSTAGQGAVVRFSDQTYGTGTWEVIAQKVQNALWAVSLRRWLVSDPVYVQMITSYNFDNILTSVDNGSTWTELNLPTSERLYAVGIANSKYIIYETAISSQLYTSQNGGQTFTQIAGSWDVNNFAISQSGQYIYTVNAIDRILYRSSNYGVSFSAIVNPVNSRGYYKSVSCSLTGQYVFFTDQTNTSAVNFKVSSNYGTSFSTFTVSNPSVGEHVGNAMSGDGSVMYSIGLVTGAVWKSTNYGASFSVVSTIPAQFVAPNTSHIIGFIACSRNGQYVLVPDCAGYIWVSSNGGVTFTRNLTIDGIPQASFVTSTTCFWVCGMSADGRYMTVGSYYNNNTPGPLVTSGDYGQTWTTVPGAFGTAGAISTCAFAP